MSSKVPTVSDIRREITRLDDKYRLAFMYQFLIGGIVSEVLGKYAPIGTDAKRVEFNVKGNKIPAVMFLVKTARKGGYLRPCAVPLEPRYEPWAEILLDHFERSGDNHPFTFSERSFHLTAREAFIAYEWQRDAYTSSRTGERVKIRYTPFTSSSLRELRR
ncbi:unnamed protein product, partial [marine sediment metagenome]